MNPERTCDICARSIPKAETLFVLRIEMLADPTPPEITEEDLHKDWRAEMEKLIKAMEKINPHEAQDEVYERYVYCLCKDCRKRLHCRLKFPFLQMD